MTSKEVWDVVCEDSSSQYCTVREFLKHTKSNFYPCDASHCHDPNYVCPNRQIIEAGEETGRFSKRLNGRTLLEIKSAEKLKFVESSRKGEDIGWNEALCEWTDKCAAIFSRLYDKEHRAPRQAVNECLKPVLCCH